MFHAEGTALIHGATQGPLLYSNVPLSFWAGTEPTTGEIIDRHHPLSGKFLPGHVLAIPSGRGSCTGSIAMLELLLAGTAPLGIIFEVCEEIVTLGVIVAKRLLGKSLPIVCLEKEAFARLGECGFVRIEGGNVWAACTKDELVSLPKSEAVNNVSAPSEVRLSDYDRSLLAKGPGNARGLAMAILVEFATLQGATDFIDISQAHIDCCVYTGPASLLFAEHFLSLEEAQIAVPTTLNAISIDQRRWAEIGMESQRAKEAHKLGNAYVQMGARPTFTCAPYLLETAPRQGENIGWAESNAAVFANSILGARTQKYPDFIDVCVALTGRAPFSGCHVKENRNPKIVFEVPHFTSHDDSLMPLLGYRIGLQSGPAIPLVLGMENLRPSISDLKAFGAAFATTSSAAMFHIAGITPEAPSHSDEYKYLEKFSLERRDFLACWKGLNTATDPSVALVALGNPHLSIEEFQNLADLLQPFSSQNSKVAIPMVITTSRSIYSQLAKSGLDLFFERVGAQILSDTCWCMLEEPVVTPGEEHGNVMTNSGKYAHYAPGLVRRKVHFGSLKECVEAAFLGSRELKPPGWLSEDGGHGD